MSSTILTQSDLCRTKWSWPEMRKQMQKCSLCHTSQGLRAQWDRIVRRPNCHRIDLLLQGQNENKTVVESLLAKLKIDKWDRGCITNPFHTSEGGNQLVDFLWHHRSDRVCNYAFVAKTRNITIYPHQTSEWPWFRQLPCPPLFRVKIQIDASAGRKDWLSSEVHN